MGFQALSNSLLEGTIGFQILRKDAHILNATEIIAGLCEMAGRSANTYTERIPSLCMQIMH
jgi:hypothetical protein